jgi:hypothetical protein
LPFNLLGISGDSSPLYHANNVKLTVTFHNNWPNRVFQTRRNVAAEGGDVVAKYKFALDTSATDIQQVNSNAASRLTPHLNTSSLP